MSDSDFSLIEPILNRRLDCQSDIGPVSSSTSGFNISTLNLYLDVKKYRNNIRKKLNSVEQVANLSNRKWSSYKKISVTINNSSCKLQGKFRLTGDLNDHFGRDGAILHSIKVKLKKGRIGDITKFKLLVPKTRSGKYEVLNVLINKELGFIAPETALINISLGGETFSAIFQEDISEALLQRNSLHEGYIIEGDEGYSPFTNPRVANSKSLTGLRDSELAWSVLGLIGGAYQATNKLSLVDNDPGLAVDYMPNDSREQFILFHLLNFALKSSGGLTRDDHRLVFDKISGQFFPIYYDGHHGKLKKQINFSFDQSDVQNLQASLSSIDIKKLVIESGKRGASFTEGEVEEVIDEAYEFLAKARTSSDYLREKIAIEKLSVEDFLTQGVRFLPSTIDLSEFKVTWNVNKDYLKSCALEYVPIRCEIFDILKPEHVDSRLLGPQSPSDGIFLHLSEDAREDESASDKYHSALGQVDVFPNSQTYIYFTKNLRVHFDHISKRVTIARINQNNREAAQVKLSGGNLVGWTIQVKKDTGLGYEKSLTERMSWAGLTGCLTLNDIELSEVSIVLHESSCEDGVHFVRATGNVNNLAVGSSRSDAIDADFSDLEFSRVSVNSAGNDCVDLSHGKYTITSLNVSECKDKGVSVGEASSAFIQNMTVDRALMSIAVKDDAVVQIGKVIIGRVDVCLAAYQKKQNFGGGQITLMRDVDCKGSPNYVQRGSTILSNGLPLVEQ